MDPVTDYFRAGLTTFIRKKVHTDRINKLPIAHKFSETIADVYAQIDIIYFNLVYQFWA